jgi:hypothetical protein
MWCRWPAVVQIGGRAMDTVTDRCIRKTIAAMLQSRQQHATACPSEIARALQPQGWRDLMQRVREQALIMAKQGQLEVLQKGQPVPLGASPRGPIRLGRVSVSPMTTPDGRYLVIKGRLWRKSNPHLSSDMRESLVKQLMEARRALRGRRSEGERRAARDKVNDAKLGLGERGPVWWSDGSPDLNRKFVENSPYKEWFAAQVLEERGSDED